MRQFTVPSANSEGNAKLWPLRTFNFMWPRLMITFLASSPVFSMKNLEEIKDKSRLLWVIQIFDLQMKLRFTETRVDSYNFDPSVILEPKLSSCHNKSPFPMKRLNQRRSDGPFPIIRHQPSQNDDTFTLYFLVDCGLSKKWIERVESIRYIAKEINS